MEPCHHRNDCPVGLVCCLRGSVLTLSGGSLLCRDWGWRLALLCSGQLDVLHRILRSLASREPWLRAAAATHRDDVRPSLPVSRAPLEVLWSSAERTFPRNAIQEPHQPAPWNKCWPYGF